MSDEQPELKAGHPPAVKAGGMRITQHKPHREEKEVKPSSGGSGDEGEKPEQDSLKEKERQKKEQQLLISGAPATVEKAFPTEAVKAFHEKPQPTHEKPTQNVGHFRVRLVREAGSIVGFGVLTMSELVDQVTDKHCVQNEVEVQNRFLQAICLEEEYLELRANVLKGRISEKSSCTEADKAQNVKCLKEIVKLEGENLLLSVQEEMTRKRNDEIAEKVQTIRGKLEEVQKEMKAAGTEMGDLLSNLTRSQEWMRDKEIQEKHLKQLKLQLANRMEEYEMLEAEDNARAVTQMTMADLEDKLLQSMQAQGISDPLGVSKRQAKQMENLRYGIEAKKQALIDDIRCVQRAIAEARQEVRRLEREYDRRMEALHGE
ncbi:unnamed protein product [Cyprideis torosa]|uniref:Uncharacterized protein n=1 Tax=Cyprideis torosa TaxID=163714 RepID=A0A7R8ZJN0_9CRUS|nr:unnamed protein product [Cyprideis torosa]CAG0887459.1 unnamed protein product [Cyprideis torosa]